jgi:enoyl-[acyl-carrier-protein] reductase (NADH)
MGQQLLQWKVQHTGKAEDAVLSRIANTLPLKRNGTAADVADAALFLISDSASFITGIALDIDGGAHLNVLPGADA